MRLPRFRLRTMIIVVAIVGAPMGVLIERHRRFHRLASFHAARGGEGVWAPTRIRANGSDLVKWRIAREVWHYDLADKYREASLKPWLPVAPDPPEPPRPTAPRP
jgi:hypothetical protein